MQELDKRRARLRFRSWHRGTREVDLILGSFADRHLEGFSDIQLDLFEGLLSESDPDLFDWITGVAPAPPSADHEVLTLLRNHQVFAIRNMG